MTTDKTDLFKSYVAKYEKQMNNFSVEKYEKVYNNYNSMTMTALHERCKMYKIKGHTKMDKETMVYWLADYFTPYCR